MLEEFLSYNNFIKNKYFKWYLNLAIKIINENRTYNSDFHEYHHLLPYSFGGLTTLPYTFKEHYIAHLLLTKFTKGIDKGKMTFSLHTFFHFDRNRKLGLKINSIIYEKHKSEYIKCCKIRNAGINNPNTDKKVYRFKNINTQEIFEGTRFDFLEKYKDLTAHDMNALIRALKSNIHWKTKGWVIFNEKMNMFSNEIKRNKNYNVYLKKTCPHCHKKVSEGNYSRWHGDNCKLIDPDGHVIRTKHVREINKI